MAAKYPVVVYGMSGYTGRLIAEYLTKRGLPFVAAGRNRERLEQALASIPGQPVADIQVVNHHEPELAELFQGAQVVVNVTGPFGQLAWPVVRAALASGCHYIDTTGESDYFLRLREEYGAEFANKKLACISACAFMWTAGMLAAELALEDPAIHSLDILYAPRGMPTIASTLSFLRMNCLPQYFKQDGELQQWPPSSFADVAVPGRHAIHVGLPWGGGFEPLWLSDEERVLNCSVQVAMPKGPLTDFIISRMQEYHELAQTKSVEELEEITNAWGNAIAAEPPKEIPEVNHTIISCWARGNTTGRHLMLYTTSAYLQTGALVAEACQRILNGQLLQVGVQPATAAFGHRQLIEALTEDGLHCTV